MRNDVDATESETWGDVMWWCKILAQVQRHWTTNKKLHVQNNDDDNAEEELTTAKGIKIQTKPASPHALLHDDIHNEILAQPAMSIYGWK